MKHTELPWEAKLMEGWSDICITTEGWDRPLFKAIKPKAYYTDFPTRIDQNGEKWTVCSTDAAIKAGNYVATKEIKKEIEDVEKANAEFIVKAVNNHEKLKEALRDLLNSYSGGEKSCGHEFTCICPSDKARAVLKEVE